jgi:hypothetical protein
MARASCRHHRRSGLLPPFYAEWDLATDCNRCCIAVCLLVDKMLSSVLTLLMTGQHIVALCYTKELLDPTRLTLLDRL